MGAHAGGVVHGSRLAVLSACVVCGYPIGKIRNEPRPKVEVLEWRRVLYTVTAEPPTHTLHMARSFAPVSTIFKASSQVTPHQPWLLSVFPPPTVQNTRSRFNGNRRRTAASLASQIIVAEPYPPPPSEALVSPPTTFVAAFAMPNADIPNNTDLRNFLVPLNALSSVSGMRFFGTGLLDETAKLSLDKEAIQVRERAGVPALPGDWGTAVGKTNRKDDQRLSIADRPRVFRHLCSTTSCRGL